MRQLTSVLLVGIMLAFGCIQQLPAPPATNLTCDATTPCPSGYECYKFEDRNAPICFEGNPCTRCASGKCIIFESYPPQVRCTDTCPEDCEPNGVPYCGAIGTRSEGWYDNNGLIKYENCAGCVAECKNIGTRSEGWYSSCDGSLIRWEQCAGQQSQEDFCGWSTNGACSSDSDCMRGGCSGQVCQSKSEEPVITTCEYRDCYNAGADSLSCGCIEGKCVWN